MTHDLNPPDRSRGDVIHTLVKAVVSAIPFIGGPATELFAAIVQPPIERRRDDWMQSVGERLLELSEKGVDVEKLKDNDAFIDTVLHTTQIALRNHQKSKRDALRAVVVNTAMGQAPDDTRRHLFLRHIDEFSEAHLTVLDLFDDPPAWFTRSGQAYPGGSWVGSPVDVLEHALPEARSARTLYEQIWKDLWQRGLIKTENLHVNMNSDSMKSRRTSELGHEFLRFIREA